MAMQPLSPIVGLIGDITLTPSAHLSFRLLRLSLSETH